MVRKKIVLTISDVHLGADGCQISELNDFLKSISSNSLGHVESLCIVGDFFDLCMINPVDLCSNASLPIYNAIYLQLRECQWIIDTSYLLGNHEIPVDGNYERHFKKRKEAFFERFNNFGCNPGFLRLGDLCQYVLITKGDNKFSIKRCDNKNQLEALLDKDTTSSPGNYCCLLLHGYQFDPTFIRKISAPIWKIFINSNNSGLKKTLNLIYNRVLKRRKPVELTPEDITHSEYVIYIQSRLETLEDFLKFNAFEAQNLRNALKNTSKRKKKYTKILKYFSYFGIDLENLTAADLGIIADFNDIITFKEVKRYALALYACDLFSSTKLGQYYHMNRISQFFESPKLYKITDVIYGHTHTECKFLLTLNGRDLVFNNDGAWQHRKKKPTYAKMDIDGIIDIENFV